jgi:hypothetical protein
MATLIDDPSSPLHGLTLSSLPTDVYLEAIKSEDDIGTLLRSHYLIEVACENLCNVLYADYPLFRHDTLSKHLRALRAYGFSAAAFRMADIVNKHRGAMAHLQGRVITAEHVQELNAQSSGVLHIPGTLLKSGVLPCGNSRFQSITEAPLRNQYAELSMTCAVAIDYMAEKRKPLRA